MIAAKAYLKTWTLLALSLGWLMGCSSVDPMVKVSLAGTDPRAAQIPWTASSGPDQPEAAAETGDMAYKILPVTPTRLQRLLYQWRSIKGYQQAQSFQLRLPPRTGPKTYRLGTGDELEITLADPLASLSPSAGGQALSRMITRLDEQGRASIPHAGSLDLAGKTLGEAQSQIKSALANYIKSPQVFVRQTKFASQAVTIAGAVASPGLLPLTDQNLTLTQALAQAGDIRAPQNRCHDLTRTRHTALRHATRFPDSRRIKRANLSARQRSDQSSGCR